MKFTADVSYRADEDPIEVYADYRLNDNLGYQKRLYDVTVGVPPIWDFGNELLRKYKVTESELMEMVKKIYPERLF